MAILVALFRASLEKALRQRFATFTARRWYGVTCSV